MQRERADCDSSNQTKRLQQPQDDGQMRAVMTRDKSIAQLMVTIVSALLLLAALEAGLNGAADASMVTLSESPVEGDQQLVPPQPLPPPPPVSPEVKVRAGFQLPKWAGFEQYRQLYKKSYRSAADSTVRCSLYLARFFRALSSSLKYMHFKSTYYLRVNSRSDWTDEELAASENRIKVDELARDVPLIELPADKLAALSSTKADRAKSRRSNERDLLASGRAGGGTVRSSRGGRAQSNRRAAGDVLDDDEDEFDDESDDGEAQGAQEVPLVLAPPVRKMELAEVPNQGPGYMPLGYRMVDESYARPRENPSAREVKWKKAERDTKEADRSSWWAKTRAANQNVKQFVTRIVKTGSSDGRSNSNHLSGSGRENQDVVWIDHRQSGCMAQIQDQGTCGSCYVFASVAYLEWAHCRETKELAKFSEQYILDCGRRIQGLNGCRNGFVTKVGEFVNKFGIKLASEYPYRALERQCPYKPQASPGPMGDVKLKLHNINRVPLEYMESVLEFAPIIINIGTSREFYEYGGGVWTGKHCTNDGIHSVLLIGHGREDGQEYWLIRNSQSDSYGEEGYLKLSKRSKCISPRMGFLFGAWKDNRWTIFPVGNSDR